MQKQSIAPYICVQYFKEFLSFVTTGLNAEITEEKRDSEGVVLYATIEIQGSTIRIQEAWDKESATPAMLYIYVNDVKLAAKNAVNSGALMFDKGENPFGEEDAVVVDMWGNYWWFAQRG